jgi:hypothetical protein
MIEEFLSTAGARHEDRASYSDEFGKLCLFPGSHMKIVTGK